MLEKHCEDKLKRQFYVSLAPGGGNGNPLQYSCLENSVDKGAWQAMVHGVAKSQTDWVQCTEAHVSLVFKALIATGEENLEILMAQR